MTTQEILEAARAARSALGLSSGEVRRAALLGMAEALCSPARQQAILDANAADLEAARGHISEVMLDRLALTPERISAMAKGIREVADLPDPVGKVLRRVERPNGLVIEKTAVPMGVIAIIYESRPNVTSDAAALAIKSGNACILRCGREAWRSANAIVTALREGLRTNGLPETAVCLIEDTTHASANALMTAVGYVDLLIPRGGAGLIRACVENAKVPCIQTGTGICHIFVDASAEQDKALDIIENAKASRPSVCNAEEVCLVHRDIAAEFLPKLARRLGPDRAAKGLHPVELRLDPRAAAIIPGTPAGPADFDTEFLDYILAVKVVDSVEEAVGHIAVHSTGHSEAILTRNEAPCCPLYGGGGQCGGLRQLLHPLYRWRGVRAGVRDGHFHPEAPRPWPHGAGRAVQLQVHHSRQRPDPLNRSIAKNIFPFFSYRPPWKDSGLYFCFTGMDCFCIETTSSPEFRKLFFCSYHDVFFISPFCTKIKSYFYRKLG